MADVVTITGEIAFKAWVAPKVAHVLIGDVEAKLPIESLEPAALDALAAQWLDHLYASVGRGSPFTQVGGSNA